MSDLFPPGIKKLADLPYPLHEAIVRALMYLSWEELPKEDKPPKKIWLDGERLSQWFREVERRHEEQFKGGNSSSEIEDPVDNDAAGQLVAG